MSALGTVTGLPSLRTYSTSILATMVSPDSMTLIRWWVRPSMVDQKPSTASRTASLPWMGSALPNRKVTSGGRCLTNLSTSNESMSAKRDLESRFMALLHWRRRGLLINCIQFRSEAAGWEDASCHEIGKWARGARDGRDEVGRA